MPERFRVRIDGREVEVAAGTTVAAALWNAGCLAARTSVSGAARGVLCAMGICFECRVSVDGVPARRSCVEPCRPGMEIRTRG